MNPKIFASRASSPLTLLASVLFVISTLTLMSSLVSAQLQERVESEKDSDAQDPNSLKGSKAFLDSKAKMEEKDQAHSTLIQNFDGDEMPHLEEKLKNGTFVYTTKPSPQNYSAGLRFGSMNFTNLQGDTGGISYKNIYGNSSPLVVSADFEYQFFRAFGKLGLKVGAGFLTAKGTGRFLTTQNISDTAFTLIGVPVTLAPVYHIQFSDRQIFVPFVEGGVDYFGLFETRNDRSKISDSLRYGGAAALHWAGGIEIQLDFLDRQGLWDLDNQYGVNHIYLIANARQIIGLSSTFDMSGLVYEGGFLVEF